MSEKTKRYFIVKTTVIVEDTEETGLHDSAMEDVLRDRLNHMQDSIRGYFSSPLREGTGKGETRVLVDVGIDFEETDVIMKRAPIGSRRVSVLFPAKG